STGKLIRSLKGHQADLYSVVFSPDGNTLASGDWEASFRLWDTATGKELRSFTGEAGAFSPDGKKLALSGASVLLCEASTVKELFPLQAHTSGVMALRYSADGKTLTSAGGDNTVREWDPGAAKSLRSFLIDRHSYQDIALSADRKTLACTGP